jgi:transposase
MDVAVGIDVAKEFHWAVATRLDPGTGKAVSVLSRRVDNVPTAIAALVDDLLGLAAASGSLQVGIDMVGGIAKLLEVMLTHAGLEVVHVPA